MGEWAPDAPDAGYDPTALDTYDPYANVAPPDYYAADTAAAGAGGDPYGSADPYGGSMEAYSTGRLPGGADGQYSPFSPDGGFDFTNTISRGASWIGGGSNRGGGFFGAGSGRFPGPALDTSIPFQEPGGMWPNWPARPLRARRAFSGTLDASSSAGDIVRYVRESTGLRVTARSIVGLIVRYGFRAAAALTRLDFAPLLQLFMRAKGVTHHRRGPGLYTIARKLRSADRIRHMASRILGRACAPHHRGRAAAPRRRRGRGRRR